MTTMRLVNSILCVVSSLLSVLSWWAFLISSYRQQWWLSATFLVASYAFWGLVMVCDRSFFSGELPW